MSDLGERPASRGEWLAVGAAWIGGLVLLAGWLRGTSTGTLREELKVWQFWSLEICVLLAAVIAIASVATARADFWRRDGLPIGGLAVVGLALTLFVAPRTNRIFYDEHIYQGIGQNLADLRLAQVCNDGQVSGGRLRCASGSYNKQPYAYPHLLSIAYRITGAREWVAFAVNAGVMALTVCTVYLLALTLFDDRRGAAFAALLIALVPEQLMWSATAAVEPSASLACALALLCAARYLRRGGCAARRRARDLVRLRRAVPPGIDPHPAGRRQRWHGRGSRTNGPSPEAGGWPSPAWRSWPSISPTCSPCSDAGWGTDAPRFSLAYLAGNLRVNGRFYLFDERFPVVVTLLAALALLDRSRGPGAMAGRSLLPACSSESTWCSTRAVTTTAPTSATR